MIITHISCVMGPIKYQGTSRTHRTSEESKMDRIAITVKSTMSRVDDSHVFFIVTVEHASFHLSINLGVFHIASDGALTLSGQLPRQRFVCVSLDWTGAANGIEQPVEVDAQHPCPSF